MTDRAPLLAITLVSSVLLALVLPTPSFGLDRNFAGSAQLDYHYVPQPPEGVPRTTFAAFTAEVALKVAVDLSDQVSANVKVCYGCHGFELGMAHFDYRLADELNLRVGRFSPTFGAFTLRHDPANQYLSDKPLIYDMGRMLRSREWNQGVLPSPFPDNGIELNGTHWFGNALQLDYAVWAVSGFKADDGAFDLDFQQSRVAYYVDNNDEPTVGGRIGATLRLASSSDLTLGMSGQYGHFDSSRKMSYSIVGSDLSLRIGRTDLRFEYLLRRQQFDAQNPAALRYDVVGPRGNFFVKQGAYAELSVPVSADIELVGRADAMYRVGNLPTLSPLSVQSTVTRYTLGTMFALSAGVRAKLSAELWDFSDADIEGRQTELSWHAAIVGTY
jgi:hypothetical protein